MKFCFHTNSKSVSALSMCISCSHSLACLFLTAFMTDTLLNVFLAIAVDNLANAQELTKVCFYSSLGNKYICIYTARTLNH